MKNFIKIFILFAFLITPTASHAGNVKIVLESICEKREIITKLLNEKHKEHAKFLGLTNTGLVLEVFRSKDNNKWTVLVNRPDGISCIAFAGEAFEVLPDTLTDPRS